MFAPCRATLGFHGTTTANTEHRTPNEGACEMATRPKPKFYTNPVILLLTMVILTVILTFVIGLNLRRQGDIRPTDQRFIERPH